MAKFKKTVTCPCGKQGVELERDEDGDWIGGCDTCGRNLGRLHTRREMRDDLTFQEAPEKKKKKGFWGSEAEV